MSTKIKAEIAKEKPAIFAHLTAIAEAKAKAIKTASAVLITILLWKFGGHSHVSEAMLYLIADNGKKSGRASGNVYMRNGRIRGFRVPALVQNIYTTPVRSLLGALSSGWRALTALEISAWNAFSGITRTDRFGNVFTVKGKQAFVMLNTNLTNVGVTPITDPPLLTSVPGITDLTPVPSGTASTFTLTFSPTPSDNAVTHLVYATTALSPGISRPSKSAFRLIGILPHGTATGFAVYTMWSNRFGSLTVLNIGAKIFVKLVPIERVTGQSGVEIVSSALVV